MRFVAYAAEKDRNFQLFEAVALGARVHGDEVVIVPQKQFAGVRGDFDGAMCLGVKRAAKRLLAAHLQAGQRFMLFDKGYMDRANYARVSIDAWQPLAYFKRGRSGHRFERLGLRVAPRRQSLRDHDVLFAGSSQKYANFHDLGDATEYAGRVIRKIKKKTARPVVYRPKPSWAANHPAECPPIDGTRFSDPKRSIHVEFARCHLLVTHGSNAAFDALIAGIPIMVLGEGICKPVSLGEEYGRIEDPHWPSDEERMQFLWDAAHCQWSLEELRSGEAWADLRSIIAGLPKPGAAGDDSMESVIAQYRKMHEHPKFFRGRDAQKHFARIGKLILSTGAQTLLDYGCGKGEQYQPPISLQEAWGVEVKCFDPGYPPFATKPEGRFDAVISCDVAEHIPERHVPWYLRDAMARASKFAFFAIATTPASKTLPDGRNCHLTVRPESWWREQLEAARKETNPGLHVEAFIQPDPEPLKVFEEDE